MAEKRTIPPVIQEEANRKRWDFGLITRFRHRTLFETVSEQERSALSHFLLDARRVFKEQRESGERVAELTKNVFLIFHLGSILLLRQYAKSPTDELLNLLEDIDFGSRDELQNTSRIKLYLDELCTEHKFESVNSMCNTMQNELSYRVTLTKGYRPSSEVEMMFFKSKFWNKIADLAQR